MCDYSLQNVRSRPAKVADKLSTRASGPPHVASLRQKMPEWRFAFVLKPTSFSSPVTITDYRFIVGWKVEILGHATAIFRQVNKNEPMTAP